MCVQVQATSLALDSALQPASPLLSTAAPEATFAALDAAVQTLSQRLRQLSNLSLSITAVQPCSAIARHTVAVVAPAHPLLRPRAPKALDTAVLRCVDPVDLLVRILVELFALLAVPSRVQQASSGLLHGLCARWCDPARAVVPALRSQPRWPRLSIRRCGTLQAIFCAR